MPEVHVRSIELATPDDADEIARLRNAVSARLTRDYGVGHWSSSATAIGVLRGITTSRVLVARAANGAIVGTLRLATKKPWAIDAAYFAAVRRPIYLLDMAVDPRFQRRGIGRQLCEEAGDVVRAWPGEAIRLDAYDHAAGAGGFYEKCGFSEVGRVTYRRVPLIYFEKVLSKIART
jgi:ribosomal protein S18 acetylase RimI-like enzyme